MFNIYFLFFSCVRVYNTYVGGVSFDKRIVFLGGGSRASVDTESGCFGVRMAPTI